MKIDKSELLDLLLDRKKFLEESLEESKYSSIARDKIKEYLDKVEEEEEIIKKA